MKETYEDWQKSQSVLRNDDNNCNIVVAANLKKLDELGVLGNPKAFRALKKRTINKVVHHLNKALGEANILEWYCSIDCKTALYREPTFDHFAGPLAIYQKIHSVCRLAKDLAETIS